MYIAWILFCIKYIHTWQKSESDGLLFHQLCSDEASSQFQFFVFEHSLPFHILGFNT